MKIARTTLILLAAAAVLTAPLSAQSAKVTSPLQQFGFNFGDDYQLATYQQLTDYWKKLDAESDRMVLQEIGRTSENRPHLMAIVTSPENHKNLAREGKVIVWIDGGRPVRGHSTCVLT